MASDILDRIGTYIKDNNTYFNSFTVNGTQLPDGRVIQFTDGKEKRFIGISDNFGTAGYIRSNPRITVPTSARRISSGVNHSGYLKQCRLVAYSWNDELTSEALMTKLVTDIRNINFTGNTRVPVITIKNTNHNYLDIIKDEFLKEPKEVGGFGFVCVAIDFDLQYWSEECSICEINTTRVPMRNDGSTYWADLLGLPSDNQDLIEFLNDNYSPITPTWANLEGSPEDSQDLIDFLDANYSTPNVGANRIGVGDVTGVLTGYAGFTYASTSFNVNADVHKFTSGIAGTNLSVRIDSVGVRIGAASNIGSANLYALQVTGQSILDNVIVGNAGGNGAFIASSANALFGANNGSIYMLLTPSTFNFVGGNINLTSGGYIYGDTTNPFIRLNNSVGTFIGYSGQFAEFVGNGMNFYVGSATKFSISSTLSQFTNSVQVGTGTPSYTSSVFTVIGNNSVFRTIQENQSAVGINQHLMIQSSSVYLAMNKYGNATPDIITGTTIPLAALYDIHNSNGGEATGPLSFRGNFIYILSGTAGSNYGSAVGALGVKISTIGALNNAPTHPFEVVTTNGNVKFYNWAGAGVGIAFGQASPTDATYALAGTNTNTYLNAASLLRLSIGGIGTATNTKVCVGSVGAYFGSSVTPTAYIDIHGSVAGTAAMRWRDGAPVTAPNDGDVWRVGTEIYVRLSGTTYTLNKTP